LHCRDMHTIIYHMMQSIAEIIEAAYELFASYTIGSSLDVCKVCCVTDAEEQALLAIPLREVSSELLNRGYLASAHGYSDQERWEFKHFLPRILELISQYDFPRFTPEVTLTRFDLREYAYWPAAERHLLADFAVAYFKQCLELYPLPHNTDLTEILLMFGLAHFDLAPLLQVWSATDTPNSLVHFTYLLLNESRLLSNGEIIFSSPFGEPHLNKQLTTWLTDPTVQAWWAAHLEQAIILGKLPPDEVECASWAYDIVGDLPKAGLAL
jgi:hypothetical protein